MKLETFILRDKVFYPIVYLMIGGDVKLAQDYLRNKSKKTNFKFKANTEDWGLRDEIVFNNATHRIIWLREYPKTFFDASFLVHEIDHMTSDILRDKDIKWTAENDEIHAYYLAYWYRKIFNKLFGRYIIKNK